MELQVDEHLRTMIRVIIWKQWKTAKKREWGLLKLGVEKWIAHKVANWGDHYQFVATKSVVARAISKEFALDIIKVCNKVKKTPNITPTKHESPKILTPILTHYTIL